MHPNPAFRKTPKDQNVAFARKRGFGVLAVNAEGGPLISHIPFQLSEDGGYLEAHLVRSNPIVRLLKNPVDAVVAVSGADAYISPDWYGVDNQVPTWNYVAVHVRGTLTLLDDQDLHGILERLSAAMESRLAPKKTWTISKMDADVYARMSRQIVPVGLNVSDIQGTWKLSQNKPSSARSGATEGVEAARFGAETDELARLMRLVGDE
jgi:transcriptional regulator